MIWVNTFDIIQNKNAIQISLVLCANIWAVKNKRWLIKVTTWRKTKNDSPNCIN